MFTNRNERFYGEQDFSEVINRVLDIITDWPFSFLLCFIHNLHTYTHTWPVLLFFIFLSGIIYKFAYSNLIQLINFEYEKVYLFTLFADRSEFLCI